MFENFRPWSKSEVIVIALVGVYAAYICGGV